MFPYSERPGTPAAKMPQLPGNVRKERAAALRAAGDVQVGRFLDAQVGITADVLVEKDSGHGGEGRSPHFAPVRIEGSYEPGTMTGTIVSARIVGRDNDTLIAHKAA